MMALCLLIFSAGILSGVCLGNIVRLFGDRG
jgi:hypothetical protein